MKNNKERKEFVEDPNNWVVISEMDGLVRVVALIYEGHIWCKIQAWQMQYRWDHTKNRGYTAPEWHTLETTMYDTEEKCYTTHWSNTNIVDTIKAIDSKKKGGRNEQNNDHV